MASNNFPVAVIGMAVRLPGARSCDEFWQLLIDGKDTVKEFPLERADDISHVVKSFEGKLLNEDKPFFTGSFFDEVDKFDADIFQINPGEAMFIEPEQRFFLETTWELLEDAGYTSTIKGSRTGVYVGHTVNKYKYILKENHPSISHGNHSPFISSRISYTHDLQGPAMMIATGCSSSLLAVHVACQGLLSGDCDMAIAGGVTLDLLPISTKTDIWNQLGITGPNVKCRAFDESANGIAKGEGCGVVLLKPLHKAREDNDHIYGILEATTANQDGHSNGITAPHPVAQANMLQQAWKLADVSPIELEYFEAHGTGTELGDPIEISGITNAFKKQGITFPNKVQKKIPIGSVKANIGHLADGAAGVVSLIKTLLCISNNRIPPSVNFTNPNPHINWDKAPVYVNQSALEWSPHANKSSRIASVSAFGLLGTNVHVVVREQVRITASESIPVSVSDNKVDFQVLALAANTEASLLSLVDKLVRYFKKSNNPTYSLLRNVCYTINTGREHSRFKFRAIACGESWGSMITALMYLLQKTSTNEAQPLCLESKVWCSTIHHNVDPNCMHFLGNEVKEKVVHFVLGKAVDWKTCSMFQDGVEKVPYLPSYEFDRKRFWPTVGRPINTELLMLEHQLQANDNNNSQISNQGYNDRNQTAVFQTNEGGVRQSSLPGKDIASVLAEILNTVLGKTLNWKHLQYENLFALGIDSLLYTHINMKMADVFGVDATFTMTDLHKNATYVGLCEVISNKVHDANEKENTIATRNSSNASYYPSKGKLFPVSFTQRRLWVMQEMTMNPCAYNATNCIKITGNFHPVAFVNSVNTMLSRHDAFFTELIESGEDLMQRHLDCNNSIHEVSLQNSSDSAEELFMQLYDEDYKAPFDLRHGPLVRCKLYRLPNEVHYFTMVIHHIVFDGWSHFLFYNELWDTYWKICNGQQVDSRCQFPLYVEFAKYEQHNVLVLSSSYEKDLAYWKNKMSGELPHTTFPGDRRRPATFTYNGDRITHFLSNDIIYSLEQFSADRYTMFMTLLSAVFVLINRYTGDNDLIIGTPIAGRSDVKFQDVIGCFVNTLALRVQIEDTFSFKDVLNAVANTCLEASDHQRTPFDHLVSQLNLPRNTSITPIFSINVCYHNTEAKSSHIDPPSDINVERRLIHNNSSKWDMQFDFLQEKEGMRFTLEYYSDVYSSSYAKTIVKSFTSILEAICNQPAVLISDINVSNANDSNIDKIYGGSSLVQGTCKDLGPTALPKQLLWSLQDNASESAVYDTNQVPKSYGSLMNMAEKIAVFLRDKCQNPKQSRIGLLLDNSVQALESILACMFAGLVYIPMDPAAPKSRLEHICNDASIRTIVFNLTYTSMANHLLWACPSVRTMFCVDSKESPVIENCTEAPLMDTELWDCVASEATNDVEGGGWKSSYTGEYMSGVEMKEYSENVLLKLDRYLKPDTKVLEIGCASGLTTKMILHRVKHYVATDLSQTMVKKLRDLYQTETNIEVHCTPADRVDEVCKEQQFDIIIMNSVAHCFPGHNYMSKVIRICQELLSEKGVIFIGDIMDLNCRDRLITSLKSFKESQPTYRVKTEWNNELFLSREFLQYQCDTLLPSMKVDFSRKIYKTSNELTEFRFDAIFTTASAVEIKERMSLREKYNVYTVSDVIHSLGTDDFNKKETLHSTVMRWSSDIDLKDEAYILYTSGTTGVPKGVIIGQEALLNYVLWACRAYKFDKNTCTAFFSPLTFDFTVTSIFPPILSGSIIRIFQSFRESYQAIASCMHLTTVKFSPLQLDTILSVSNDSLSASIFILGGEEVTPNLLSKLKQNKPTQDFVVWNEYGPTETTVGCVVKEISSDILPLHSSALVPIGKPIDNVTVVVLGNNLKPIPLGGKGILGIGGKSLCSGFTGKTNCSSVKAACWGRPGNQMLITDDLVEVTPTSCDIVYFGRKASDSSKINGIRIDFVEIQEAIESSYIVDSAWVCSFAFETKTYLGAAVKLKHTHQKTNMPEENWKCELMSSISHIIPARSIPKLYISVTCSPTNANGKKDTKLLQRLFAAEMKRNLQSDKKVEDNASKACPVTKKLQELWQSILPINHLPQEKENFFYDLSGDSLQAIHLARKMKAEGFRVSVTDIFQNPTIKQLLLIVSKNTKYAAVSKDISDEEETEFKPTPIVEEFLNKSQACPDHFSLSALLKFHSSIDSHILRKALRSVMRKHASLRSQFKVCRGKAIQSVALLQPNEPLIKEVVITSNENNLLAEAAFTDVCKELEQCHSLSKGILLAAALIHFFGQEEGQCIETAYALLAVHHAAIDIVSWQQILQDLAIALQILSEDPETEPNLTHCSLSFQTYCSTLHAEASGILACDIPYWTDVGKQCEVSGTLVDEDRQSRFESAVWVNEAIDADILRSLSLTIGRSEEHILLTVFGRALSLKHGRDTTAICLESHGRQLATVDTTETVGWFTSQFPLILNTPITEDLVQQVQRVEESMNMIPNHGLSFGVLKSAGKLNIPYPKILFVFQGSMDASTKEIYNGGYFKFEHVPWIEVMKHELHQGRFHRHPEELLEFDLEIIAWIHSGKLQLGCLFDEKTISQVIVQDIVATAGHLVKRMATRANDATKKVSISIFPEFNITTDCVSTIKEALRYHDISVGKVELHSPEQLIQSLYKTHECNSDILLVIPRHRTKQQATEFVQVFNQMKKKIPDKNVILFNTETIPNTASQEIHSLIKADAVIQTPRFIGVSHYDSVSDEQYNMPFTPNGYTHFGLTIARTITALVGKKRYKAIAVDADYTLWEGECAQGQVAINPANIALQKYLVKCKENGMLLVILSKNNNVDIQNVFVKQNKQMILKDTDFVSILANWESKTTNIRIIAKMLNIGLDAFVFIDDNALECEQMLNSCPSVLTLQLPSGSSGLIMPLIENLWALDMIYTTTESNQRTEMYRDELGRQQELQTAQNADSSSVDLNDLLQSWKMKLAIYKCTVGSIKTSTVLYARVKELLQRTNQFKLNDINVVLDEMSLNSECWLVSLCDVRGSYGIVSIALVATDSDSCTTLTQWVVSCRALGRHVEQCIFREMYSDWIDKHSNSTIRLALNATSRNTPMLKFLETIGIIQHDILPQMQYINLQSISIQHAEKLHEIEYCRSQVEFQKDQSPKCDNEFEDHRNSNIWLPPSVNEITEWVESTWTKSQKDQATYHHLYPIIPKCSHFQLDSNTGANKSLPSKENVLKQAWMEVLESQNEPQEQSNFLECGGNSFKAVFLVSKLRRVCGVEMNIADVLQNPVYSQIKAFVQHAQIILNEKSQLIKLSTRSFPLSSAQQRMAMLQQTAPKSTAYVETIACCTSKSIDPTVIMKSFIDNHPLLTSTIEVSDNNEIYTMTIKGKTPLEIESEPLEELDKASDYLTNTIPVIDVISSPLYRFRYLVTAALESIFVLHIHHIIVDDVTLRIMAEDLDAIVNGKLHKTNSNHRHYSEYVHEEKMYYTTEQHDKDKKFWKETFLSPPPDVSLDIHPKSDSTQNTNAVFKAKEKIWRLQQDSSDEITQYCKKLGVTEFQYFLACTSLVIQRYIGVNDFVIAIPVTTRNDLCMEADGLFINTVLFRVKVNKNQTFHEYIKFVADTWLQTFSHSRYPLDRIAMSLWKEHGKSLTSFCSVMFNFTTHSQPQNMIRIRPKHAKMPLSIDITYDKKMNSCKLVSEWADSHVDDGMVDRLSDAVVNLCSKGFQTTEMLLKVEILSPLELQLLHSFNTETDSVEIHQSPPVYKDFEEHAATEASTTAIFFDGNCTSYGQLNSLASRIAYFLRDNLSEKVLKQKPVVTVMKKDPYAIAAILGIWKAGGHFLPVATINDCSLEDIFNRETPAALLYNVETTTIESLPTGCPVWSVDDMLHHSRENEVIRKETCKTSKGSDIAYIIRTSGSTGIPKQCRISHRSLRTVTEAWKQKYSMATFMVNVLQWAPLSFDVFIGDVIRALVCVQGKLILCPDNRRLDIPYIRSLIRDQHVTVVETTPQFGFQMINNSIAKDFESIKLFILGSDVLQEHLYKQIKSRLNFHQRLINSYGMTEATIDSAYFDGDVVPATRSGTVPIGKPLPGVMMHILDSRTLQPCPVGTIGELYISGDTLATGDVELIQLNHCPSKALKTGDAACWLPTGDIELFGRLDNMVKLRGFRISTTEIENKLVDLIPGVNEAYVTPMSNDNKDMVQLLVAYFVMKDDCKHTDTITHHYVCNKLRRELPYYMLPDRIHIIEKVPLTSHGKVNKHALPNLPNALSQKTHIDNSPTTLKLKEWFAEALGLLDRDNISNDLTFMEQGGHSLILVRFWSLIESKSVFKVEIADLFSYPTIYTLAEFIERTENIGIGVKEECTQSPVKDTEIPRNDTDIAITGIGVRLPGGIMSLAELWDVLQKGEDLIGKFPEARKRDVLNCLPNQSRTSQTDKTFEGAFLKAIDTFDHRFFKIAPGEAKFMSPEQRIFLQVATEALADGSSLSTIQGSNVGVFVGSSEIGYAKLNHPDTAICVSGLMPGMIATRVAYQWDLKGPTMMIDTACSSSLVALKEACESIKRKECIGALVGGVNLVLYPSKTGVFGQTNILSQDYHCRAFDKDANGTAVGEGVMCIYIEALSTALEKRKPIYAVVKSVASNSVGHGNGITAPSANSQTKVIQDALESAYLSPSAITFVEGHGTGTNLGDRIEISSLSSVFSQGNRAAALPIGSVKCMFGHLDSAAGLLGVFKVLACMASKSISPTANFKSPHPELLNSALYVPSTTVKWDKNGNDMRAAGVSAFGLTGTNCHTILVENISHVTHVENDNKITNLFPLIFIGETMEQLKKQAAQYKIYIEQMIIRANTSTLESLCLTVALRLADYQHVRKNTSSWRMVIIAETTTEFLKLLHMITNNDDTDFVMRVSCMRSDIHLWNPNHYLPTDLPADIQQFLKEGVVDISQLFHGKHTELTLALGVNVALYQESRHWLDTSSSTIVRAQDGNLLDLFQEKLYNVREMVRSIPLAPTKDLENIQKQFCSSIIVNLFLSTALAQKLRNSEETSFEEAFSCSEMLEKYRKLFFVMIRELWGNDLVQATGRDDSKCCLDTFRFKCEHFLETDMEAIANLGISKYPAWTDCFQFPLYCSKYLRKVLWGEMSPLSVIYPQGDLNFMYQFDKLGDQLGDIYYNMYMQLIAEYAKQLSRQGKQVRVLEVGAGVGYVTRQLLPKLKNTSNVEYWFTDLGKAFVEHAKTLFSKYQYMMKFCTFDITKSPLMQGLFGTFDIVISYNVIHTTQSIMESVLNLKSCLGEDGTLFIIESAKNDTWATLAWGILDGWWYFEDYDLRPAEPMLAPEKWEQVLSRAGFDSVVSCPQTEQERRHVEKFLFFCSAASMRYKSSNDMSALGWWETDENQFDPIKRYNMLEEENKDPNLTSITSLIDVNTIHQELNYIWCDLLGIDQINPDDDFNALGGESLLAIQMMNLVRKRIGYQLEIADTFGYPTLNALANFIGDQMQEQMNTDVTTNREVSPVGLPEQITNASIVANDSYYTVNGTPTGVSMSSNASVLVKNCPTFIEKIPKSCGSLLMFPGQGAQKQGMCMSMKDSPEARKVFDKATEVLGYDLLDIFLKNDSMLAQQLKSTEFVQVSLLVSCIAKIEQLKIERPDVIAQVKYVAGLSVGEFAALVYADVISFEDAIHLVQERGRAMEVEVQRSPTGMVSVFGLSCEVLEKHLLTHFPKMRVSTYLADNQHTVAGTVEDCEALTQSILNQFKEEIVDVRQLRVAGAFHSTYMSEASKVIDPLIDRTKLGVPSLPVIMNVSGDVVQDPKEMKILLREQLQRPVQWKKSVVTAYNAGIRNFFEVAPARVLSSIVKNRISICKDSNVELITI